MRDGQAARPTFLFSFLDASRYRIAQGRGLPSPDSAKFDNGEDHSTLDVRRSMVDILKQLPVKCLAGSVRTASVRSGIARGFIYCNNPAHP
jgi:hypothetical protein